MIKSHYSYGQVSYDDMVEEYIEDEEDSLFLIKAGGGMSFYEEFKRNLIRAFPLEAVENPNSKNAWLYLTRGQQMALAAFQSNASVGKPFIVAYDNDFIEVIGEADDYSTKVEVWLPALYSAIILRNKKAIDFLITIDNSVFAEASLGEQNRPFDYAFVDLLKAVFTPGANLASAIEKALVASNPDDYEDFAYLYASRLKWPLVDIIMAIFSDEGEHAYNKEMKKALLLHKEYFNTGKDSRRADRRGAISIPLTAMAVLAKDVKGYDLTIENGYIPQWVIDGKPVEYK
ncbi:immunity 49 family protein [Pseudoalteromonas distincta]|uniref:immunity 49 family protein n=1 Tax=Pseudoalteromonas distincta TaxID=77608 RepID=UPI00165F340A|nr:immunity 49 family protein [Pseudoalteromonas distincta]MBD0409658.1 immunity 49 family protein [Pseudoalteromonas distincta]